MAAIPNLGDTNSSSTGSGAHDERPSNSIADDNASLTSSILGYQYENGRRYHAYREGSYLLPNDAEEQDRLDLQHHIYRLQLGGALYLAPLDSDIKRVLDFGTGTGIWAIDFADEFENAEIFGVDLSPIQPGWLPPNCRFFVDDIESEWTWSPNEAFDYIHGRGMAGSVSDWPLLHKRVLANLKPGAWYELQEYDPIVYSFDDPEMTKAPTTKKWQTLVNAAANKFGKSLDMARNQKHMMMQAGFEDVQEEIVQVPIGPWAKDPRLKEIGRYQREHMSACVAAFTLAPLTRIMGWKVEEVHVLMAGVRREFCNPKLRLYTTFRFITGRRPITTTSSVAPAPTISVSSFD